MPIRRTFSDIIATAKAKLEDGVKLMLGTDEDWSIRSDGTDIIIEEEGNQVALRLNAGNKIQDVLESGGAHEMNVGSLSGDLADAQDPKAHASSHFDGGADELDAADLAGAQGTDGQVLTSTGAAAQWEAAPSGGSLTALSSASASGDSTAEITSGFSSTYQTYIVVVDQLNPATDRADLRAELTTDGGSNWATNTYTYAARNIWQPNTSTAQSNGDIVVTNSGIDSNEVNTGAVFKLHNFVNSSHRSTLQWDLISSRRDKAYRHLGGAQVESNVGNDGIRFLMSSGNISGEFKLYGVSDP